LFSTTLALAYSSRASRWLFRFAFSVLGAALSEPPFVSVAARRWLAAPENFLCSWGTRQRDVVNLLVRDRSEVTTLAMHDELANPLGD